MHTNTKHILLIVIVINLVLLSIYGGLVWWMRSMTLQTTALTSDLAYQSEREIRLNSAVAVVRDTINEREQLAAYFVNEDAVVNVITDIESLGEVAELSLDVVSVTLDEGDAASTDGSKTLSINLTTSGSWQETSHLLALFETLPRAMVITQFSLSYAEAPEDREEDSASSVWNGAITVEALIHEPA